MSGDSWGEEFYEGTEYLDEGAPAPPSPAFAQRISEEEYTRTQNVYRFLAQRLQRRPSPPQRFRCCNRYCMWIISILFVLFLSWYLWPTKSGEEMESAMNNMTSTTHPGTWSSEEVADWVKNVLHLPDAAKLFEKNEIDGYLLFQLEDRDLIVISVLVIVFTRI